jgi:hypothetical protein
MKQLVAYQFRLNFLYQGKDVKHFVGYCVLRNLLEQREDIMQFVSYHHFPHNFLQQGEET